MKNSDIVEKQQRFRFMVKNIKNVNTKIIDKEEEITNQSPYRQQYHIESNSGILNDPNGLCYFDNQYHIFYQWTPLAFTEKPKLWHHGWYHLSSDDLVHWRELGPGIESDTNFDKHGAYSGSALRIKNQLFIMYTGNTWDEDWNRVSYQLGAWMDQSGNIQKIEHPLIDTVPNGYTSHFRDPKVWKSDNKYYAILGAQRDNLSGSAVVYESKNLTKWNFKGEIKTNTPKFGYMWECPDYFEIENFGILLFSPQGLQSEGENYQNVFQTGCFVGQKLDLETLEFPHNDFQELDSGFDFYATQTMKSPDGRRILSGWMGISTLSYPTEKYHYAGSLIFPRELSLEKGKLLQNPVQEIKNLRHQEQAVDLKISHSRKLISHGFAKEIKLSIDLKSSDIFSINLLSNKSCDKYTKLTFDKKNNTVILDRKLSSTIPFDSKNGNIRSKYFNIGNKISLEILTDRSSIEIFINGGETVFSARVFPDDEQEFLFIDSPKGDISVTGQLWNLK